MSPEKEDYEITGRVTAIEQNDKVDGLLDVTIDTGDFEHTVQANKTKRDGSATKVVPLLRKAQESGKPMRWTGYTKHKDDFENHYVTWGFPAKDDAAMKEAIQNVKEQIPVVDQWTVEGGGANTPQIPSSVPAPDAPVGAPHDADASSSQQELVDRVKAAIEACDEQKWHFTAILEALEKQEAVF